MLVKRSEKHLFLWLIQSLNQQEDMITNLQQLKGKTKLKLNQIFSIFYIGMIYKTE